MFKFLLGFFIIFTLIYALFMAAVVYHIRQYTLPEKHLPRLVTTAFIFLSGLFWLFALYFLFKIPK